MRKLFALFSTTLTMLLLMGQTTEQFPTYINSLPVASIIGAADQFYIRQGGVSKQVPFSTIETAIGTGISSIALSVPQGLTATGTPCAMINCTLGLTWAGPIPNPQMPFPTLAALGGVEALNPVAGQFVTGLGTNGQLTTGTLPGGGNVSTSGTITSGNCAQWNSANTLVSTGAACGSGSGGTSSFQTVTGATPQSATVTGDYVFVAVSGNPAVVTVTMPASPTTGQCVTFTLKASVVTQIQSASANIVPMQSTSTDTIILGNNPNPPGTGIALYHWASSCFDGTNWQMVAGLTAP